MNHTVVVYPGTDSTFFVAPRIKALSNEVNKRFHDLESQMHKTNFDAASVFARLDSVEAEPVRNSRGSKTHVLFGDSFGGYSATLVTRTQMWKMLKLRILIAFQTYNKGIPCQTTLVVPGPFCMFYISRILYSYSRCCPPADLSVLSLQNLQDSPDSRVQRFDILWLCFFATSCYIHNRPQFECLKGGCDLSNVCCFKVSALMFSVIGPKLSAHIPLMPSQLQFRVGVFPFLLG